MATLNDLKLKLQSFLNRPVNSPIATNFVRGVQQGTQKAQQGLTQLPQLAQQQWNQGGLITNHPLLSKIPQPIQKPLVTATRVGPAPFMSGWAKGVGSLVDTKQNLIKRAGNVAGAVYQTTNPFKTMAGGVLGVPFNYGVNALRNAWNKRPIGENFDPASAYQQGFEFQSKLGPAEGLMRLSGAGAVVDNLIKSDKYLPQILKAGLKGGIPMAFVGAAEPEDAKDAFKSALMSFVQGFVFSGAMKGVEIPAKTIWSKIFNTVKVNNPGISDELATKKSVRYIMDESGHMAGSRPKQKMQNGFVKDSQISDADRIAIRRELGLPDKGPSAEDLPGGMSTKIKGGNEAIFKAEQEVKNILTKESQLKEKSLIKRIKVSERYPKPLRKMMEGTYVPQSNASTISDAKRLVRLDPQGAETRALSPQNAVDQAIGIELFNYYMDKGMPKRANGILNATSGTNEGQMIQILSQYDKTSPAGIVRFAQNILKQHNKNNPNKTINLTDKQISSFYKEAQKIQGMKEGTKRNIAANNLINKVNELVPSSTADKFVAVWKAGLLTSLRTHERNIFGNTIMSTFETAKDVPASIADIIMSAKTGKRSMTLTTKGTIAGAKEGAQSAKDIITLGFDPQNDISKYDFKTVTWGKNPVEQALKKYTDAVFRTLGAEDKVFWRSAYARSLYNQAGAEAINSGKRSNSAFIKKLVNSPTTEMMTNATKDANTVTFRDINKLTDIGRAIQGIKVGGVPIGQVLAPFVGVPTSIAGKTVAYSPVGLAKGIVDFGRVILAKEVPNLQRQAAQEIGRGVMGTSIFALGAYLASKGLMTGQPKDITESRLWESQNKPRNSVLIDGKWRSINSVGPQTLIMLAGAKAQEELSKGKEASLGTYGGAIGKDFLSQTFLAGVQGPLQAVTDPNRYGKSYVGSQLASGIPNIVKDVSKSLDPYQRESNTITDYIKSGIPIARNTMIPKRDVFGEIVPQEPSGVAAFYDLFSSKTPKQNIILDELQRLYNEGHNAVPGKLGKSQTIQGVKKELSPEELNNLEAQLGPEVQLQISRLITSPNYQLLEDEQKANAISNIVSQTRKKLRATADVTQTPSDESGLYKIAGAEGLSSTNRTYTIIDPETGSVKQIDLSVPIERPSLTRNETINKRLISSYKTDISTRIKNIVTLYEDGQISIEEASKLVDELQTQYNVTKVYKPKKVSIKGVSVKPVKIRKLSGIRSIKLPAPPSIKKSGKYNVKAIIKVPKSKIKQYKIKKVKNTLTQGFTKLV